MTFVLTYPAVTPTHTVTLRNPSFGDVETQRTRRQLHITKGNQLRQIEAAEWPVDNTFHWEFTALEQVQVDAFRAFLSVSLGDRVRIVDHLGETRFGFIYPQTIVITTNRDTCDYAVNLEFFQDLDNILTDSLGNPLTTENGVLLITEGT